MTDYDPSALFVSSTDKHPREIIELLLKQLPDSQELEHGVLTYPWHIDTKYYEVDVNLCTIEEKSLGSKTFSESVQAVILYFDSDNDFGLEEANKWLPFVKEYEAEIQILLCSQCKEECESGISKLFVQEWCIKEGFELVELNPKLDEEWECEQDFIETTGIKRVQQALEAHQWPKLILKERREPTSMSALLHGGLCRSEAPEDDYSISNTLPQENVVLSDNAFLEELLSDEDASHIGFSDLFGQLVSMKERASSLPNEQRKEFAERVVRLYWKAIGGDEQEICDN